VEDGEEMVTVLIDLRPLVTAKDVFVGQSMKVKTLLQPGSVSSSWPFNIDPTEAVELNLFCVEAFRLLRSDGSGRNSTRATEAWLRKAWHPD